MSVGTSQGFPIPDKYIEEIDNSHEISEEQKKGLKKSIKEKEEIDLSFGQILP